MVCLAETKNTAEVEISTSVRTGKQAYFFKFENLKNPTLSSASWTISIRAPKLRLWISDTEIQARNFSRKIAPVEGDGIEQIVATFQIGFLGLFYVFSLIFQKCCCSLSLIIICRLRMETSKFQTGSSSPICWLNSVELLNSTEVFKDRCVKISPSIKPKTNASKIQIIWKWLFADDQDNLFNDSYESADSA